jgi:hypothetical protein
MRRSFTLGLVFSAVALLFHAPLFSDFFRSSIGGGDLCQFMWDIWHFAHRATHGQSPFECTLQAYPLGLDMAYTSSMPLVGLLSMPLLPTIGLIATYNLWLVASTLLACGATYRLARLQGHESTAAAVAAILFALAPALTARHMGHLNLVFAGLVPLGLASLERLLGQPTPRRGAAFGTCVAATLYTDYYTFTYLVMLSTMRLLWSVRRVDRSLLGALATSAGVLAILALPLGDALGRGYEDYGATLANAATSGEGGGAAEVLDYLRPPARSLVWSGLVPPNFGADIEHQLFLGAAALVLSMIGAARTFARTSRGPRGFWVAAGALFFLLSLGPRSIVGDLAMPYALLLRTPLLRGIRVPTRCGMMVALAVAMLSAAGFEAVWRRRRMLAAAIAALGLAESLKSSRLPESMGIPTGVHAAAAEGGDFSILSLPFGWKTGTWGIGAVDRRALLLQTVHTRHHLSLDASRGDAIAIRGYYLRIPAVRLLLGMPSRAGQSDLESLRDGLDFFDVRYVEVPHWLVRPEARFDPGTGSAPRQRRQAGALRGGESVRAMLPELGAKLVSDDQGYEVYRLAPRHRLREGRCRAGEPTALPWFGPGWQPSQAEIGHIGFSGSGTSPLFLPMSDSGRAYRVDIRIHAAGPLRLEVRDRAGSLGFLEVPSGCVTRQIVVASDRLEEPLKPLFLDAPGGQARFWIEELASRPMDTK